MGLLAGKTLAAAVAPGDTHLTITPPLALGDNPAGQPIQIGSELMMVTGGKRGILGLARAADSAHTQGTAIAELNRFVASAPSAGGVNVNDTPVTNIVAAGATIEGSEATLPAQEGAGGLTVDNQVDDPAEVTTLIAPGAVFGPEGTVTTITVSETDPGALGENALWLQVSAFGAALYVRTSDDISWNQVSPIWTDGTYFSGVGAGEGSVPLDVSSAEGEAHLRVVAGPSGVAVYAYTGDAVWWLSEATGGLHIGTLENAGSDDDPAIFARSADPSAGGGLAAPLGSMQMRQSGGVGEVWVKVGAADTAWELVTTT